MTAKRTEMTVLASMIDPRYAKRTREICLREKLRPRAMFTDPETLDAYFALRQYGPEVFGGYVVGERVADLAVADVRPRVARIVRDYKRHLAEMDRTLDSFETPGPDKDDPDCLFQNRWLRRGMCGAIVSTSGVGKSSITMELATVWAKGEPCLGVRPMKPLKIGIFQSEDDEYDVANFRDRIRIGLEREMGWDEDAIREAEGRVTFCALDGTTGQRFVEHIRVKQRKYHFDLIIINPLFAFFGGDLNDGSAMTDFLRHGIDPLIKDEETKCGCLIVHHTGKPKQELINQGDIFAAYLGSGSGEFTNYIRSALVLTPHDKGKLPGVFDFVAAKHGDKLGWKDADGKFTTKKIICHATKLPEYADSGMIFWVEPDAAQLAELKKRSKETDPLAAAAKAGDPTERCAEILAEHIRKAWTATMRPTNATDGQREWVQKLTRTGFSRITRAKVYDQMMKEPYRWNLTVYKPSEKRKGYLIGFAKAEPEDMNLEAGDMT